MNEEEKRITLFLPLSAYLQELILTGILGVMGVLFLLAALLAVATAGGLAVVFGIYAAFVLWLCAMSTNRLYRYIEIMPDKLVINRFGGWRKEIPLEELKLYYPGIPWMQAKENGTSFSADQKDKDPLCYRRGRPGDAEGLTIVLLLLAILIVPFLMILMAQSLLAALGPALLIALLVGIVYPLLKSEWDIIHLSPEKLQVMRDKKVYTELRAEKIATIVVEKEADSSLNTPYIAVSELSPEQLAACEVARRCKQKHGQKQCEALYALPDWQTRFAIGYCRHVVNQIPMRKDPPILIAYSTQREETLRSLYPTAKWLYNDH